MVDLMLKYMREKRCAFAGAFAEKKDEYRGIMSSGVAVVYCDPAACHMKPDGARAWAIGISEIVNKAGIERIDKMAYNDYKRLTVPFPGC